MVQGFETFVSSLINKTFRPAEQGAGVDLVFLSPVLGTIENFYINIKY